MRRRSFDIEGFAHGGNPIPAASRIGNFIMTGGIHGLDRQTGKIPDGLEAQVANMFANLEAALAAAGGSLADVLKMTFWTKVPEARDLINQYWIERFPDSHSRPSRHTMQGANLAGAMLVQCDAFAVVL